MTEHHTSARDALIKADWQLSKAIHEVWTDANDGRERMKAIRSGIREALEVQYICKCGQEQNHADENTICTACRRIGCFTAE